MKIKNKIKNKIKLTREEKGLKQTEIAEKTQKSIRTYQDYESGERPPDVYVAVLMAEAFEIKTFEEFKDLFGIPQRQLRETSSNKKTQENSNTRKQSK